MDFIWHDDGSISVKGGIFDQEAEFDLRVLKQARPELVEVTIRLRTREGVAVYIVDDGSVSAPSNIHTKLLRVEG
jgi:hypothetical protein